METELARIHPNTDRRTDARNEVVVEVRNNTTTFPEDTAPFLSRMLFSWMGSIFRIGRRRPLQDEDIWLLNDYDRPENLLPQFEKIWEEEKLKPNPSLRMAVHRMIWKRFWAGAGYKLFNDASQFTGPIILSLLIVWISTPNRSLTVGILLSIAMFVFQMIGAFGEAAYFQRVMRSGMNAKGVLVLAIFKKTLHISNASKQKVSTGKINTMIAADTDSVNTFINSFHNLWSAPLRIIVTIALIFSQLRWAGVIGACLFPVAIPLQKWVIGKSIKFLKASLQFTDQRIKIIGEVLSSMSVVKSYDWQESFQKKVEGVRSKELSLIRSAQYLGALNYAVIFVLPIAVAVVAFAAHVVLFDQELTVQQAFTSLALFAVLTFPLFTLPQVLNEWVNSSVALRRIQEYLLEPNLDEQELLPLDPSQPAISISNVSFFWDPSQPRPTLHNIDLCIKTGELVAIIGPTGSGKSSLLNAMMHEMSTASGTASGSVVFRGSAAYVPQQAWIFGASLRENILFGRDFDEAQFRRAIDLSCLGPDIALLSDGVNTELGERGITLSGGQAQRTSIARAVYADAETYLFDDPLSALDANVGKQIFQKCIRGALEGRTRVLVTNQLQYLTQTDRILMLKDGHIVASGTFEELQANSDTFRTFISSEAIAHLQSTEEGSENQGNDKEKQFSEAPLPVAALNDKERGKLVTAEEREVGRVDARVIKQFLLAFGGPIVVVLIAMIMLVSEACRVSTVIWLKTWTGSSDSQGSVFFLQVYALLSLGVGISTYLFRTFLAYSSLRVSFNLHQNMFSNILKAPMLFFDQTPVGRMISRFSKDVSDIDKVFAGNLSIFVTGILQTISTFGIIVYFIPLMICFIVPVSAVFYVVYRRFVTSSREIQRLDSISRSPIYNHFSQCLNGLASIRAYRAGQNACELSAQKISYNQRFMLANFSGNRWLSLRLEFLGGMMAFGCSLYVVLPLGSLNSSIDAAITGLLISYALQVTSLLNRNVRLGAMVENQFNAVERIIHYTVVPCEPPAFVSDNRPSNDWPQKGFVRYVDVCMRYREGLPLVLNGLNVEFPSRARIGIVGRTGAGKSSMFVSLFRLRELASGRIEIDGVDISKIGLSDLRSRITVIPQTPVLFTGTVRSNLDPFDQHNNEELWSALRRAHVDDVIQGFEDKLNHKVSEGGENFSVGQRALLCLARALLRRSKLIMLDEATASVDPRTDELIQQTIRSEFGECTLLIIAHRLHTVMDSDKILVMSEGKAVEYGVPAELLKNPRGYLTAMVNSTGPETSSHLKQIADRTACAPIMPLAERAEDL